MKSVPAAVCIVFAALVCTCGGASASSAFVDGLREFVSALNQITIITDNEGNGQGRGNHGLMKIAVPLIAGFKTASIMVAALVALKGLLLKALAFSGLAMMVSAGIAFKYLYDKVQSPGLHDTTPYYNSYGQGWGGDQIWQGTSGLEFQHGHDIPVTGGGDLQGHFSENIAKIANHTRLHNAQRKSVPQNAAVKTTIYKTTIKRYDSK